MFRVALFVTFFYPAMCFAQSLPATLVARTGQDVPGVSGATFTTIGVLPRLGANGHVAFNSGLTGGGATNFNNFGFWVGTPGNLQLAIRQSSNDGGPELFDGNNNVGVDANGRVSLWTSLSFPVPIDQNQKLWDYLPDGASTTAAWEGNTVAPGFAGGVFSAVGSGQAANNAGALAFVGSVRGGDATNDSDFGLFTGVPGDLKLVAREGTPAPGATGTAPVFSTTSTTIFDKRINNSGQVGFAAALSGAGVSASNDRAIYVWTPNGGSGTLALAAQTGNNAPGTSATINFTTMDDQPGFNDAGQVAFTSQLTSNVPGEINLLNNYGIWAGTPGNIQLVIRANTATPISGLVYRTPDFSPRINASGQVAFFSLVSGTGVTTANDKVFWLKTAAGVEVVAREGSAAPGTLVNFNVLDSIPVINGPGQVAFTASLTGTGVTSANDRGLWAGLPGSISLVAREGDVIDVDPGPGELLKTIQFISFANGFSTPPGESASAALNDAGQIAWRAQFTDNSTAVFLTALPIIDSFPGDFNNDGKVDAGDYVAWRKNNNTNNALPNDNGLGTPIGPAHYALWRANFGKPPGSGARSVSRLSSAGVPEPASMGAALSAAVALLLCRRARN